MKVNVIRKFRDKETKKTHQIGEEVEVTKKRFEEINSTSFGVFVEKISQESKEINSDKSKKDEKKKSTKKK